MHSHSQNDAENPSHRYCALFPSSFFSISWPFKLLSPSQLINFSSLIIRPSIITRLEKTRTPANMCSIHQLQCVHVCAKSFPTPTRTLGQPTHYQQGVVNLWSIDLCLCIFYMNIEGPFCNDSTLHNNCIFQEVYKNLSALCFSLHALCCPSTPSTHAFFFP